MRYLGTIALIIVYACLTRGSVSAQTTDERLLGLWDLDSIELTVNRAVQKYSLPALLANRSILPRNMLTSLYFFDDQVGVNNTEMLFDPGSAMSLKGSFVANNGELTITFNDRISRSFRYEFENERLRIRYSLGGTDFYLIYKLLR